MNTGETEFLERKAKVNAFKAELKALIEKHNFGIKESDNYDGQDEYTGSNYHFIIDEETWWPDTIADIFNEAIGRKILSHE